MDTKLYSRLDLLADNTLSNVLERNRLRDLKLNVDKHELNIEKNINQIKDGLKVLSEQQSNQEQTGARGTETGEEELIRLGDKLDRLNTLFTEQPQLEPRRNFLAGNKHDVYVEMDNLENGQILQLQQRIIDDQDQDLDQLSLAIQRQRELGQLIGDELETHAQIIEETEEMVDRSDERLRHVQRKLNYVNRKLKDNKSICIVAALIIIFFVLVALFR